MENWQTKMTTFGFAIKASFFPHCGRTQFSFTQLFHGMRSAQVGEAISLYCCPNNASNSTILSTLFD